MNDKMTMLGDWAPPNPSPRTLMNNFLNEDFGSKTFSDLLAENGNEGSMSQSQKQEMVVDSKKEEAVDGVNFSSNFSLEPSLYDGQKSCSKGGLAQRMAKAGFNAPTINTARIRSSATSPPEIRSPYLTIPPGLSPTTLLDSPVFLSNMAQPSPTTGKISFAHGYSSNSISASAVLDKSKDENLDDIIPGGFAFKPPLNTSSSYFSTSENKGAPVIDHQQSLQSMEVSIQQHFNRPGPAGFSEPSDIKDSADDITFCPRPSDSFIGNENSPPLDDQPDTEGDPKGEYSSMAVAAPAEDGYNWRKYGQKQVKGSEYPRSYYKCTHPNCQVKKKVERSHEGHITEIIYKGAHNHPKPPPNRRSVIPSSHPFNDTQMDGSERPNYDGKRLWGGDGVEATSSASVAEFGDPAAPVQQDGSRYESPEAIDISSTLSNDEEEDDRATHGSVSLGGDGEGDETESKRRKLDASAIDMSAASRAVREPRVVVQTTSEVDILDDGYRWRKYGQKVVKGNPNPRSYYKCTNPGCNVRKHVERASHDLKAVITTYEGKHNHDVPAARNSSHSNAGPSSNAPPAPPTQPHILHRRPEQTHDGLMRFNGRPPLSTFGLPGREQLNIGPGFSFGMSQQGFPNLGLGGLGPLGPMRMPVMGPIPSYMGPNRQAGGSEAGFMIPKGEPKEEPVSESGLPMSNGMTAYHQQLMSRLPLGPQL